MGVKAEVGPVGFVYQEQTAAPVGPVRQGAERLRDAVVRRPGRQVNLFISGSDLVSGRLGRRIQVPAGQPLSGDVPRPQARQYETGEHGNVRLPGQHDFFVPEAARCEQHGVDGTARPVDDKVSAPRPERLGRQLLRGPQRPGPRVAEPLRGHDVRDVQLRSAFELVPERVMDAPSLLVAGRVEGTTPLSR